MKLIKLADKSEFGWRTAIEYEQDDLASDCEDEKRIQKSVYAAKRKWKAKRGKFCLNRPTGSFSTCLWRRDYTGSRLATSLTYFITRLMGEKFAGNDILWLVVL